VIRRPQGAWAAETCCSGRWLFPLYRRCATLLDQICVCRKTVLALREVMISGEYVFANDRETLDEAALAKRAADAATRLDGANQTRLR